MGKFGMTNRRAAFMDPPPRRKKITLTVGWLFKNLNKTILKPVKQCYKSSLCKLSCAINL